MDADELLKEAISMWKKDGYFDNEDENSQFYNIAKDPIVKLFMAALAHQTNNIKDEIFNFKANILEEFLEKIIPYNLIKPIPAFSIIQIAKEESIDHVCSTSAETPFIFEKEKERKRGKGSRGKDSIKFIPLLKTKIIKAKISSVQKREQNRFLVTMEHGEPLNDLSGISFYFPNSKFSDISVSLNNRPLPLIKHNDFENLPFTEWFDFENILFEKSLIYGTMEFWRDIIATNDIHFCIVDQYDSKKVSIGFGSKIELIFEFTSSDPEFNLNVNDIKINCVPIVNVEKQSVTLSNEKPIIKIASEKNINQIIDSEDEKSDQTENKQFLNLLAPFQSDYEREAFTLRRFGMERFNKNELLIQIKSILSKYASDYYAFMDNEELKDGEKMKNLNIALKEVVDELKKEGEPDTGIYLVLNQGEILSEQKKSIEVSYLLTDGERANGINSSSVVRTPIAFDKKTTQLLLETRGGNDMEMNKEIKNKIAQYYLLTKDKLVTKSDIRSFCYKELLLRYSINKDSIEKIDIRNEIEFSTHGTSRYVLAEINLKTGSSSVKKEDFINIENQLISMIKIRSTNVFPIRVKIINS